MTRKIVKRSTFFKNKYLKDNLLCQICAKSEETQIHIFECEIFTGGEHFVYVFSSTIHDFLLGSVVAELEARDLVRLLAVAEPELIRLWWLLLRRSIVLAPRCCRLTLKLAPPPRK